jgi:hypothetical protein
MINTRETVQDRLHSSLVQPRPLPVTACSAARCQRVMMHYGSPPSQAEITELVDRVLLPALGAPASPAR